MRTLLLSVILILTIDLAMQSCASIASPTGGPRDTIPPVLLGSTPPNGSVTFTEQEFRLSFSEFVKADKIQQQLIITPRTENRYKTSLKRNDVILKFVDPFEDSTTYNFNFADGITDITENNPAVNLSLAFSTGPYIDSLSIEGNVIDLFKQEEVKGYTVGLYPLTDTLDYFKEKPIYFTTTNDSGTFNLNYLKAGIYRLLVFNDDNRNITLDPETEEHGFIPDTIRLDSSILFTKTIATVLQNVKPITFINSRPTGPYIELKYSKQIDEYNIQPEDLKHSLTGETKEVIRIYKTGDIQPGDSLTIYSVAKDSLGNEAIDTIRTAFIESNRKPSKFSLAVEKKDAYLIDNYSIQVKFSKPVLDIDTAKIFIQQDTSLTYQIEPEFSWNENQTLLTINSQLTRSALLDTLISIQPVDTTAEVESRSGSETDHLPPISFTMEEKAFVSIESDSSSLESFYIPFKESSSFGTVKLQITTSYESFTIQLLDSRGAVAYSSKNQQLVSFPRVTPGTYAIRALIDNDLDGNWSPGNLLLNQIPEDIYLHTEETSVRENWVLEIPISF